MVTSKGRIKIYTDQNEITADNVLEVLQTALAKHEQNASDIDKLLQYERGDQPLPFEKTIRPEVDVQVSDNAAAYVKDFKIGYFWAEPAFLVQHGHVEAHGTEPEVDSAGIAALNEMLSNGAEVGYLDQQLAEFVEVCGIGHQIVDIKRDIENENDLLFEYSTLDSRYAFCVYYNGIGQPVVMGVSYRETDSGKHYTVITEKTIYEIENDEIVGQFVNPLGMVNIVEFERSVDRMGCFERQVSDMDALITLCSTFVDDSIQRVQEVWWANDVDFPRDKDTGKIIEPREGQWIMTSSHADKNPKLQPVSSSLDAMATLAGINARWNRILQKCKVPTQQDSSGGGSTGVAMDMSTGWAAAEVDAAREQKMIEHGKRKIIRLILKAISLVPADILPLDSPIRKVHITDVDLHFNRQRNYDLTTKSNAIGTLLAHGIYGKHALSCVNLFPDVEQVWLDSKDSIQMYQASIYERYHDSPFYNGSGQTADSVSSSTKVSDVRTQADNSDQNTNSPLIDGPSTGGDE